MVNIWDFCNAKRLLITDIDNNTFCGTLWAIFSLEDETDLGLDEDNITICVNGQPICFKNSEIAKIQVLE